LDYLCAFRTPPHFSFINPAERLMATLNIGLMGVALARNDVGKHENKVNKFTSKEQWRKADAIDPMINYKKLAKDGTKEARNFLEKRFASLEYKGEHFNIETAADDKDIIDMKNHINSIWPDFDVDTIKKHDALRDESFKQFFDTHVRLTNYCLTIKKCDDLTCKFHSWHRLPDKIFESLKWIPTPVLTQDEGKYKDFSDVWGTEPTDQHCPSIKNRNRTDTSIPKSPFQLLKANARLLKVCDQCEFPRILYSKKQLTTMEKKKAEVFFDNNGYICGMDLSEIPYLYQHQKTVCYSSISLQYYQLANKLSGYKKVCYKCLNPNTVLGTEEKLQCEDCIKRAKPFTKKVSKNPVGRPKNNLNVL